MNKTFGPVETAERLMEANDKHEDILKNLVDESNTQLNVAGGFFLSKEQAQAYADKLHADFNAVEQWAQMEVQNILAVLHQMDSGNRAVNPQAMIEGLAVACFATGLLYERTRQEEASNSVS